MEGDCTHNPEDGNKMQLNESAGTLFRTACSTDKTTLIIKVKKRTKIRNRYN